MTSQWQIVKHKDGRFWEVWHTPSGFRVALFVTRKSARQVVKMFGEMGYE